MDLINNANARNYRMWMYFIELYLKVCYGFGAKNVFDSRGAQRTALDGLRC